MLGVERAPFKPPGRPFAQRGNRRSILFLSRATERSVRGRCRRRRTGQHGAPGKAEFSTSHAGLCLDTSNSALSRREQRGSSGAEHLATGILTGFRVFCTSAAHSSSAFQTKPRRKGPFGPSGGTLQPWHSRDLTADRPLWKPLKEHRAGVCSPQSYEGLLQHDPLPSRLSGESGILSSARSRCSTPGARESHETLSEKQRSAQPSQPAQRPRADRAPFTENLVNIQGKPVKSEEDRPGISSTSPEHLCCAKKEMSSAGVERKVEGCGLCPILEERGPDPGFRQAAPLRWSVPYNDGREINDAIRSVQDPEGKIQFFRTVGKEIPVQTRLRINLSTDRMAGADEP